MKSIWSESMVYVHVKMHIQNDIKKQTIIRYQYPSVYIPKSLSYTRAQI